MNDMTARTAPFDIHDRPKADCPECGGTGRKQQPCPECKGRGSVLDQRKIRQVSQAISHGFLKKHDPAGDTPPSDDRESPAEPRKRSREFPEP